MDERYPEDIRNHQEPPQKEFSGALYHVIPAQIFDDDRLSANEKLFYGLLSGLTHRDGYCYAKDKYFAERMRSQLRVIQEWINSLERYGYIRRETKKIGMYWERKIFLTHSRSDSNNSYEQQKNAGSSSPPNSKKMHIDTAQKCEENIEGNNIELSCSVRPGSGAPKRPGSFEKKTSSKETLKVSESQVFSYALKCHPDWTTSEIEYALEALWKCKGPVNTIDGFLEGTIKKLRNKKSFEKMEKAKCKTSRKENSPTASSGSLKPDQKSPTISSERYADKDTIKRLFPT